MAVGVVSENLNGPRRAPPSSQSSHDLAGLTDRNADARLGAEAATADDSPRACPAVKSAKELDDDRWDGQEYASTNDEEDSTADEAHEDPDGEDDDEDERKEADHGEQGELAQKGREDHQDRVAADGEKVAAEKGASRREDKAEANAVQEEAVRALQLQSIGVNGLVAALGNVLTHLASLGCTAHRATIFHASSTPQISIQDYLVRIAKYYQCSEGCLVLSLVYIDRLVKLHPDFVVSSLNIHRLLATSVMLAAKFHDDVFYSNKYYGKVAGVRVQELNRLEENFLRLINWQLYVLPGEYEEYLARVLLPLRAQGPQ